MLAGCNKPIRPGFAAVAGEVTFDGAPIPSGWIQFEPVGAKLPAESAPINAGRYTGLIRIGPCKVRVNASRPTGKISDVSGAPIEESYIPARYNNATELTADVVEHKNNTLDFRLESSTKAK